MIQGLSLDLALISFSSIDAFSLFHTHAGDVFASVVAEVGAPAL
jgi:hypothetical protein